MSRGLEVEIALNDSSINFIYFFILGLDFDIWISFEHRSLFTSQVAESN